MSDLITQLIGGGATIFNFIQSFLANPSINLTQDGIVIPGSTVVIEAESYDQTLEIEVSQQMVMNVAGGKQYFSDNLAPKPRVWEIKGYLAPAIFEITALSPALQPTLALKTNLLIQAYKSRQPIQFNMKNQEGSVIAGMKSLKITSDPTIINRVPIQLTIQEIVIFTTTVNIGSSTPSGIANAAAAPAASGSVNGIGVGLDAVASGAF